LRLGEEQGLALVDGSPSGLVAEAFAVPGKIALYLEDKNRADFGSQAGDTIGFHVREEEGGAHFFFLSACARLTPDLKQRLHGAPLVFFDGTLWRDDEMIRTGTGTKTGKRMGHLSNSGPDGTIALFRNLEVKRKVFIHINNSNPILLADSPERAQARGRRLGDSLRWHEDRDRKRNRGARRNAGSGRAGKSPLSPRPLTRTLAGGYRPPNRGGRRQSLRELC
jgi:hypothetical protein